MNFRNTLIVLVLCGATISATTRPEDPEYIPPQLTIFIEAAPPHTGKPLGLVFEIKNRGQSKMEIAHSIPCGRSYSDVPDGFNKQLGSHDGLWYEDGEKYMVVFQLTTPLPKEGFLQLPDLGIDGGPYQPTFIDPGKAFLYRIDLPGNLRLHGTCEIRLSLIQKKREVVRSDTAKINFAP